MADFATTLSCSLGLASLELESYTASSEGVYDAAGDRIATKLVLTCQGEISAATPAGLAAAISAFRDAADDGADFSISSHGSTLESIDASDCIEGPRVKYSFGAGGAISQPVSFSVEATIGHADANGVLSSTKRVQRDRNVEDLLTIRTTGQVRTDGTVAASLVVTTGVGDPAVPLIPAREAGWQLAYSYQADELDQACSYSATETQLVAAYPASGINTVLDGERLITTAADEHNRLVTTYAYDYVGSYAQAYVEARHAELRAAGGLLRASIAVTGHKTRRASASFEVLAKRNAAEHVLELTEAVSSSGSGPLLTEYRYPGTAPIIVAAEQACRIYEQAGRAIGLGAYPQPPAKLFAEANLLEVPQVAYNRVSDNERETTWRYRFIFTAAQAMQLPHGRAGCTGTVTE